MHAPRSLLPAVAMHANVPSLVRCTSPAVHPSCMLVLLLPTHPRIPPVQSIAVNTIVCSTSGNAAHAACMPLGACASSPRRLWLCAPVCPALLRTSRSPAHLTSSLRATGRRWRAACVLQRASRPLVRIKPLGARGGDRSVGCDRRLFVAAKWRACIDAALRAR